VEEQKEDKKEENKTDSEPKQEEKKNEKINLKDCSRYLKGTISSDSNDPEEVKKLQEFLNKFENANLVVDGNYGPATIRAVNRYQRKYYRDILYP